MKAESYKAKYRSKARITQEFLSLCRNPSLKTHVMWKAGMSYAQFIDYSTRLLDSGLVESVQIGDRHGFIITEKGRQYLKTLSTMETLAPSA